MNLREFFVNIRIWESWGLMYLVFCKGCHELHFSPTSFLTTQVSVLVARLNIEILRNRVLFFFGGLKTRDTNMRHFCWGITSHTREIYSISICVILETYIPQHTCHMCWDDTLQDASHQWRFIEIRGSHLVVTSQHPLWETLHMKVYCKFTSLRDPICWCYQGEDCKKLMWIEQYFIIKNHLNPSMNLSDKNISYFIFHTHISFPWCKINIRFTLMAFKAMRPFVLNVSIEGLIGSSEWIPATEVMEF